MYDEHSNIEKYDFECFEKEHLPFTMVPNQVIQKMPAKHMKAGFLWIFLQSLPTTWEINKKHIINHFNISARTYETWMAWLNAVRLIEYRQERKKNGSFGKWKLVILNGTEFDLSGKKQRTAKIDGTACHRSAIFPLNGETDATANCAHINTTTIESQECNINGDITRARVEGEPTYPQPEAENTYPQVTPENEQKNDIKESMNAYNDLEADVSDEELQTFELFWSLYPIKKAKQRAKAIWITSGLHGIYKIILEKLEQQTQKDKQFIDGYAPHPARYLSDRRWEDEITEAKNKKSQPIDWDTELTSTDWIHR